MGRHSRMIKERAAEFDDQYDETMIEELKEVLADMLDGLDPTAVSSELIEETVVEWQDRLPDINDWCFDQVNNELDEIGDQKMEEARDRAWEEQDG